MLFIDNDVVKVPHVPTTRKKVVDVPQRHPNTPAEIRTAQHRLRDAFVAASNGNYGPALNLACHQVTLRRTSGPDIRLRIWDSQIMTSVETYLTWLEAVQRAYRQDGLMTAGTTTCVMESLVYWYSKDRGKHPGWTERMRALSEMPEFEPWTEEINQRLRKGKLKLDEFETIA